MYSSEEQRLAGKIIHDFELIKTLLQEIRVLLMHSQILPRLLCLEIKEGRVWCCAAFYEAVEVLEGG